MPRKFGTCLVCEKRARKGKQFCCEEHSIQYRKTYLQVYYRKHKEEYRENLQAWRKANPEKRREQQKRYQEKRKEKKIKRKFKTFKY